MYEFFRWFTQKVGSGSLHIKFDKKNNLIQSKTGLRVIEIRKPVSEMVIESWVFMKKVLKFQFQIPQTISFNYRNKTVLLVVEDNVGGIYKDTILM